MPSWREKEQRLGVAEAKPELNFSPLLGEASQRYPLLPVLLFRFQVTLEKPWIPFRPLVFSVAKQGALILGSQDPQGLRIQSWQLTRHNKSCHLLRALDTITRGVMHDSSNF